MRTGQSPEIEPGTSHSAVIESRDWKVAGRFACGRYLDQYRRGGCERSQSGKRQVGPRQADENAGGTVRPEQGCEGLNPMSAGSARKRDPRRRKPAARAELERRRRDRGTHRRMFRRGGRPAGEKKADRRRGEFTNLPFLSVPVGKAKNRKDDRRTLEAGGIGLTPKRPPVRRKRRSGIVRDLAVPNRRSAAGKR